MNEDGFDMMCFFFTIILSLLDLRRYRINSTMDIVGDGFVQFVAPIEVSASGFPIKEHEIEGVNCFAQELS